MPVHLVASRDKTGGPTFLVCRGPFGFGTKNASKIEVTEVVTVCKRGSNGWKRAVGRLLASGKPFPGLVWELVP